MDDDSEHIEEADYDIDEDHDRLALPKFNAHQSHQLDKSYPKIPTKTKDTQMLSQAEQWNSGA